MVTEDVREQVTEKINKMVKEALTILPPKVMLKTARLITGDQIIGRFLCTEDGSPIVYKYSSDAEGRTKLFVRVISPTTIRVMWVPIRPGEITSVSSFEEWMSNSSDEVFPIETSNIMCMSNADDSIAATYDVFTLKTRLYKRHPDIAKHLFENAYFDIPENYNEEMDEIEDGWDGDSTQDGFPPHWGTHDPYYIIVPILSALMIILDLTPPVNR